MMPYALMGRARTEGESDDQVAQAAQQASSEGAEALSSPPEPMPPGDGDESAEAEAETETSAPTVPARRPTPAPRQRRDTGRGELKTTGLRG